MSITGPMTWTTLPLRCFVCCVSVFVGHKLASVYVAAAPDTTSMISRVIAAWRTLFM